MAIYPPSVSTWGVNAAIANQLTTIAYTGIDGSVFFLAGPFAPIAGAQDGLVLTKFMGLMSPFEMLELRGARQDGATWTDAVYDVGEIMLSLEVSGIAPQNMRDVMRYWIGAWDPKTAGTLSVFTPDQGEWWANVRQGKNVSDMFEKDYTYSGRQTLIWSAKNYDAFWYGPDSISTGFNGNTIQQVVTTGFPVGSFTLSEGAYTSVSIPASAAASTVQTCLEALTSIGAGNVVVTEVKRVAAGVTYQVEFVGALSGQLVPVLVAGVSGLSSGVVGIDVVGVPETGYASLTNTGDQPAWPRYLCYGPGTFYFGNGPFATSGVTFGPLYDGQIVLVTTEPRLRSVVDLTPNQPAQSLGPIQTILSDLISFATNNNVPPLLQQFESLFGILPPQGNLYSLMNGRFTVPIPATPYGVPPETQFIPVGISGGNANSQLIAAITPMKKWPL